MGWSKNKILKLVSIDQIIDPASFSGIFSHETIIRTCLDEFSYIFFCLLKAEKSEKLSKNQVNGPFNFCWGRKPPDIT